MLHDRPTRRMPDTNNSTGVFARVSSISEVSVLLFHLEDMEWPPPIALYNEKFFFAGIDIKACFMHSVLAIL